MKEELEALSGRKVDLLMTGAAESPFLRAAVNGAAIDESPDALFAAG